MEATAKVGICALCGEEKALVMHHISYIPEVTQRVCRKCDRHERRTPTSRGLLILKGYPQQGQLAIPAWRLEQLGDLVEALETPVSPLLVLFPYGTPLRAIRGQLNIVCKDLDLRIADAERSSLGNK